MEGGKSMLRGFVAFLLVTLVGCASPTAPTGPRFTFPGRSQGEVETLTSQADRMWERVRRCADADGVEPEEPVMVWLVIPGQPWACPPNTGGCFVNGERIYALDWRAGVGYSESFGHELIHLARWLKAGDADPKHTGPWWVNGRACQSGLEDLIQ
jgi:hypothetical protein